MQSHRLPGNGGVARAHGAGQIAVVLQALRQISGGADEVGADGYAPDAASAVDKAKELLGIS